TRIWQNRRPNGERMSKILKELAERPTHYRQSQHGDKRHQADHAQHFSAPDEQRPSFAIQAEDRKDQQHRAPDNKRGNTRIASDGRKYSLRRLSRRYPPGNRRRYTRNQHKSQQLTRNPAFNLGDRKSTRLN